LSYPFAHLASLCVIQIHRLLIAATGQSFNSFLAGVILGEVGGDTLTPRTGCYSATLPGPLMRNRDPGCYTGCYKVLHRVLHD